MGNLLSFLFHRPLYCKCGHKTKLNKIVERDEERVRLSIRYRPFKPIPYCLDCAEKMTIICPWCGKPIFVGDYVTLYTPTDPNFKIPEGAVVYSENPLQLVGCQRSTCAETGADYCGIWDVPGVVKRFLSAIERAMMTGGPVIMNL